MAKVLFFFFPLFFPYIVWSQNTNVLYPDMLAQFDANMYLVNAGYIPTETSTELTAFYKFQTGAFKDIATLSFSAAKFFRTKNESAHALRISAFNEKQGPYISSPRAYASYAYELPLGTETSLAGGLAAGMAGMNYSGVSTTGNLNVYLPDASAGIVFKFGKLHLGGSGQQLLNSKTKPFSGEIELRRYYHLHFRHEFDLNENIKWRYYGLYRQLHSIPNELLVGTSLLFANSIGIGVTGNSNSGLSVFGQVGIDSEKDHLKLIFNYNTSFLQRIPKFLNSIELGIGYLFK